MAPNNDTREFVLRTFVEFFNHLQTELVQGAALTDIGDSFASVNEVECVRCSLPDPRALLNGSSFQSSAFERSKAASWRQAFRGN